MREFGKKKASYSSVSTKGKLAGETPKNSAGVPVLTSEHSKLSANLLGSRAGGNGGEAITIIQQQENNFLSPSPIKTVEASGLFN